MGHDAGWIWVGWHGDEAAKRLVRVIRLVASVNKSFFGLGASLCAMAFSRASNRFFVTLFTLLSPQSQNYQEFGQHFRLCSARRAQCFCRARQD